MPIKILIPEPEPNLKFIDVHCHLPFPRPKNDKLPSDKEQYITYFKMGGQFLITSTIDIQTLNLTLDFRKEFRKKFGFTEKQIKNAKSIVLRVSIIIEPEEKVNVIDFEKHTSTAIGTIERAIQTFPHDQ